MHIVSPIIWLYGVHSRCHTMSTKLLFAPNFYRNDSFKTDIIVAAIAGYLLATQ